MCFRRLNISITPKWGINDAVFQVRFASATHFVPPRSPRPSSDLCFLLHLLFSSYTNGHAVIRRHQRTRSKCHSAPIREYARSSHDPVLPSRLSAEAWNVSLTLDATRGQDIHRSRVFRRLRLTDGDAGVHQVPLDISELQKHCL